MRYKKNAAPRQGGRRRKNRKDDSMSSHCNTARERMELKKALWELSREANWAHWEIFKRIHGGATLEEARDEVFSLYERHGEDALHANGTPGDRVELMTAIFPELDKRDVVAVARWYKRQSRRLKNNKRMRRLLMEASSGKYRYRPPARRGEGAAKRTKKPSARGRTPHPQARRSTPRACRSAAKAGDDGGGSDDGADGDSEPPRPVIPSAPVWAHRIPLGPHNRIGFFPSRRFVPRSWRLERGRSA